DPYFQSILSLAIRAAVVEDLGDLCTNRQAILVSVPLVLSVFWQLWSAPLLPVIGHNGVAPTAMISQPRPICSNSGRRMARRWSGRPPGSAAASPPFLLPTAVFLRSVIWQLPVLSLP